MTKPLLEVSDLRVQFDSKQGVTRAVNGASFAVDAGSVLGLVGESGCGKSVTALSVTRLLDPPGRVTSGRAVFRDGGTERDLLSLPQDEMDTLLGDRISMVFQDPLTSLNPVLTVGYQITEPLRVHRGMSARRAREEAARLLRRVGIPRAEGRLGDYPHEFSGGMRQRVMIAMAAACRPRLLIADEPTTALDVTVQAQILRLLRGLTRELGTSVVLITHDLGVIAQLADRVAVMYAGRVVEDAPVREIFKRPRHPYTRALVSSIPRLGRQPARLPAIEGAPPSPRAEHEGCAFEPRCPVRLARCAEERPPLAEIKAGVTCACWVALEERAPERAYV